MIMEKKTAKIDKKQLVAGALAHVYTDVDRLIKAAAQEHTIANLGQSLEDHISSYMADDYTKHPERLVPGAYSMLRQDCESDEMAGAIEDEYDSWLKQAKKDIVRVQAKNLPLTLENMRAAYMNEGPFAGDRKPAKKKK
jgi:hypothetical protein